MNEFRDITLATVSLLLILAAITFIVIGGLWHYEHVACLRLSEQTVYRTRMAGNMFGGGCYIQINGRWIPAERYRSVDLDDAS